jgi:hypothetical protein
MPIKFYINLEYKHAWENSDFTLGCPQRKKFTFVLIT